jgi:hypothetical protein
MDEMELLMDSLFTTIQDNLMLCLLHLFANQRLGLEGKPWCSHCLGYQTLNSAAWLDHWALDVRCALLAGELGTIPLADCQKACVAHPSFCLEQP